MHEQSLHYNNDESIKQLLFNSLLLLVSYCTEVLHHSQHKMDHSSQSIPWLSTEEKRYHDKSKQKKNAKNRQKANLKQQLIIIITTAHMCVHITVHYYSTQYGIELFLLILQTIIIAQMLSTAGEGITSASPYMLLLHRMSAVTVTANIRCTYKLITRGTNF